MREDAPLTDLRALAEWPGGKELIIHGVRFVEATDALGEARQRLLNVASNASIDVDIRYDNVEYADPLAQQMQAAFDNSVASCAFGTGLVVGFGEAAYRLATGDVASKVDFTGNAVVDAAHVTVGILFGLGLTAFSAYSLRRNAPVRGAVNAWHRIVTARQGAFEDMTAMVSAIDGTPPSFAQAAGALLTDEVRRSRDVADEIVKPWRRMIEL